MTNNMKRNLNRGISALLIAAALIASLTACGSKQTWAEKYASNYEAPAQTTQPTIDVDTKDPVQTTLPNVDIDDSTTIIETNDDNDNRIVDNTPAPAETNPATPSVNDAEITIDLASIQGVARLKDLVGSYALSVFEFQENSISRYIFVDTEDEHNPYDLTWRYGPDITKAANLKNLKDPEWDALYREYVTACDWSLVFDADYYKKAFPMLAKLYHEDDALLLEHFQTQGVHEGRQASAAFNVAAYMTNCDKTLVTAFGDDYECYYFYYMLNQTTQRDVNTTNSNGTYPRWLTVELSWQQIKEHEAVNEYREEAGVQPVELDPETISLANYRAWYDAEHNMYAHNWTTAAETRDDVNDCLWRLSRSHFAENTVKWYSGAGYVGYNNFYHYYRRSESHNATMISDKYFYSGYSNPYYSNNPDNPRAKENGGTGNTGTGYVAQFDLYTEARPSSPYELG